MNNYQKIIQNLKPGDIILSRVPGSPISETIMGVTRSKWSHALMYIGNNKIIESDWGGVVIHPVTKYANNKYELGLFRYNPELSETDIAKIIKLARKKLGIDYGWFKLLWLGFLHLIGKSEDPDWKVQLPKGMICSQLVSYAYLKAGFPLKNLPPELMEPTDLDESDYTIRIA